VPEGNYESIIFKTAFEHKSSTAERVILVRDAVGWRVIDYRIYWLPESSDNSSARPAALQHAHCARDEKNHDTQRDRNLDHGQNFGPAREQRRVSRAEGGALGKGDKEIIDEARSPASTGELGTFVMGDLHLRKKKTGTAELLFLVTPGRAASIQPPIPEREDNHIGQPEQSARTQKFQRRFLVRWKSPNQKRHGSNQRQRGDSVDEKPERTIERLPAGAMTNDRRNEHPNNQRRQ